MRYLCGKKSRPLTKPKKKNALKYQSIQELQKHINISEQEKRGEIKKK